MYVKVIACHVYVVFLWHIVELERSCVRHNFFFNKCVLVYDLHILEETFLLIYSKLSNSAMCYNLNNFNRFVTYYYKKSLKN